jgi:hypothetical protein
MKKLNHAIILGGLFLLVLSMGCSPCSGLINVDQALQKRFQELKLRLANRKVDAEAYRLQLNKLRAKELEMFEAVRQCDLKDPVSVQYWYNNRLKYPSLMEQELDRLTNRKWYKQ